MLQRRDVLSALTSLALASGLGGLPALAAAPKRQLPWRNWSGSQQCLPQARLAPASVSELQELVVSTAGVIRPVGSGHSFSALVPTEGTLVSLSRMAGVGEIDHDSLQATIGGGTRLGDIGQPLQDAGQALINMPVDAPARRSERLSDFHQMCERVRTMPAQFGAVDRRLVYQKHIRRMSTEEIALYVFLQCVSDAEGLSFYSDERICNELRFSLNGLWKAREGLVEGCFLLYSRPIYQLLDLPEPPRWE